MPIEHKALETVFSLLAHLDMAPRSSARTDISCERCCRDRFVNHTIVRHEFSIPAVSSLATGGRARGLERSTNAHPTALERVLAAKMLKQTNCCANPRRDIWALHRD